MKRFRIPKKYIVILSVFFLVTIFLTVIGVSYSFFVSTVRGKEYVMYTGNLEVVYEKAENSNVIHMENAYPITNEEGLKTTPYEFKVKNTGNINAKYQVRLELDKDNTVPLEYMKLSYQKNGEKESTPVLLSDLGSSLVFIKNVNLIPTKSDNYKIKLWIDINAGNEIQGKTFSAQIVVDSIQELADNYEVDTRPILTLKEGTSNINLKVNDKYEELGVEKIEDDQEIFTSSDVVEKIEYYNGISKELQVVESVDTTQTGVYYITYQVTDRSENTGQVVRVVTVNSGTPPSITLVGDATITLGQRDYYKEQGATIDNINQLIIIGEVKTKVIGTYTVRYIVVDSSGNLASVTRTINVDKPYQEQILNGAYPELTDNLIPVTIEENGTVKRASTLSTWYSYQEKKWANVVVLKEENKEYENNEVILEEDIESYFVWIPKYKYKLFNMEEYNSLTSFTTDKPPTIEVQFGLTNTSNSNSGECTTPGVAGEKGSCKKEDYMTHPAFLAFDSNGFWVGKFETGYEGANTTKAAEINRPESDKIIIKPNVYSWRNINVGNAFQTSYEYLREEESHMMKNTEWGAVAYLQHSKYGSQESVMVNNNSAYITGYAATEEPEKGYNKGQDVEGNHVQSTNLNQDGDHTKRYNSETGYKASTTGNITGVYDMSGGAWEYVMGYTTSETTSEEKSGITTNYSEFFTDDKWKKYYDSYSSTTNIQYNNRILGDATGEMGPFGKELDPDNSNRYKSSWYKDYASFTYLSNPWFHRGGTWVYGSNAGVFAFSSSTGNAASHLSFRLVLTP